VTLVVAFRPVDKESDTFVATHGSDYHSAQGIKLTCSSLGQCALQGGRLKSFGFVNRVSRFVLVIQQLIDLCLQLSCRSAGQGTLASAHRLRRRNRGSAAGCGHARRHRLDAETCRVPRAAWRPQPSASSAARQRGADIIGQRVTLINSSDARKRTAARFKARSIVCGATPMCCNPDANDRRRSCSTHL
jgi:hypothetical protein